MKFWSCSLTSGVLVFLALFSSGISSAQSQGGADPRFEIQFPGLRNGSGDGLKRTKRTPLERYHQLIQDHKDESASVSFAVHPVQYSGCFEASIWILVDWSGSVKPYQGNIRNAVSSFISGLSRSWQRRIFFEIITFGDLERILVPLTNQIDELQEGLSMLSETEAGSSKTVLSGALRQIFNEVLEDQNTSNEMERKMIVLISDGLLDPEDREISLSLALQLHEMNVEIYSLDVGAEREQEMMLKLSNAGYFRTNLRNLARTLEQLEPCL